MGTVNLSDAVDDYLASERSELFALTERLVTFDTQNPPGGLTEVASPVIRLSFHREAREQ